MGGGLQMEKRTVIRGRPKAMGLDGLFWRYLLTTGGLVALVCLAWLLLFNILINMGLVLSAYTAVRGLEETEQMLQAQTVFDPSEIPHIYGWALVEDGEITESSMNQRQLEYARREWAGSSGSHGWFYPQYFHLVPLRDGRTVMLEYDYSVCYRDPNLQASLPDFQTIYIGLLVVLLLLVVAVRTRHYTKLLRQDTQAITTACNMVGRQQLEEPLQGQARVRELQAALTAIETLRQELSCALKEQWASEQQKNESLAALAHDLKTPLTVIQGNAELLVEEDLAEPQKERLQAILRNARHAEEYVGCLREVTARNVLPPKKEAVSLGDLLEACAQLGRDLTTAKGQTLELHPLDHSLAEEVVMIGQREVLRAVENLLNNGVRFTPDGGVVALGVQWKPEEVGIWVQDSGPGFSPEALAKGGKTFYTEDGSRPQDGHMGMGLYVAAQVAKEHGGCLTLENTTTGGRACLWLCLEPSSVVSS